MRLAALTKMQKYSANVLPKKLHLSWLLLATVQKISFNCFIVRPKNLTVRSKTSFLNRGLVKDSGKESQCGCSWCLITNRIPFISEMTLKYLINGGLDFNNYLVHIFHVGSKDEKRYCRCLSISKYISSVSTTKLIALIFDFLIIILCT